MRCAYNITELFNFVVHDNHIMAGGRNFYFYRFFPPNLSVLTDTEKESEILSLSKFLDSIAMEIQIFTLDKVEDLSKNKAFFRGMKPAYQKYTSQIVAQLDNIEASSEDTNSVQRAYYFVVSFKNMMDKSTFEEALRAQDLNNYLAEKPELVTILRNYILREFVAFDLYNFEHDESVKYDTAMRGRRHDSASSGSETVDPVSALLSMKPDEVRKLLELAQKDTGSPNADQTKEVHS